MKASSKSIIFFGSDAFSATHLAALLENGWDVPLVITTPAKRSGRGRKNTGHPVLDISRRYNVSVATPNSPAAVASAILPPHPPIAVLASYGVILQPQVLSLFPKGIVNVHPSLLPRWRGPSPIESAILAGDKETGVSLMKLTRRMDAGPIYAQRKLMLDGSETQNELYQTLARMGSKLLIETLPYIVNNTTNATPQPRERVTYSKIITKQDGVIDWRKPAEDIERQIRAFLNWPQSRTEIAGIDVIITKCSILKAHGRPGTHFTHQKRLAVYAGKNALVIERLKPAGRSEMSGADFLRGYLR